MATSQQFLVCDNSTAANFVSWASAISNFIRSMGWTNSSDTGQLNGAGAGNWSAVTTVPGSGAAYYEIFEPGDGLQNFYLKLEYGNSSGAANSPTLYVTLGTGTNGSGVLSGYTTTRIALATNSYTAPSTSTTYECDLSGDGGRLSLLLWRNASGNAPQFLAIQRALSASGNPVGSYVTCWLSGSGGKNSGTSPACSQTLHFTYGATALFLQIFSPTMTSSQAFGGKIPLFAVMPCVGVFDYPCTAVAVGNVADYSEGVPFTVTNQYGQTKTYMPTRAGTLNQLFSNSTSGTLCAEYD